MHRQLRAEKMGGYFSCMECTGQGNAFELVAAVEMETRHHVERSFGNKFPSIYNRCEVMVV